MKFIYHILLLVVCSIINFSTYAQQYRPYNAVQIYEQLQQLNHLTNVMYLAAHPDDENTRLLAYLAHHRKYNTIYLSLTRGDGGQNLIGTELGTGLGLIRNYELIAARNIDGAKQAFTSFVDFGFSKTPDETFHFWDKRTLIDEVKAAIKKYRPDVIICRFPTDGRGGHGHHTTSAIVGVEAYKELEKEQYQFLPQRVLFNAFRFGDRNTITDDQFRLSTNQYNPLLGESYGEMAGRSRSIHHSQGVGTPQTIGIQDEYFELMAGTPIAKDIIDRDISWNRVTAPHIQGAIEAIIQQYDFTNPAASIPALIRVRKDIQSVKDAYWRNEKLKDVDAILLSMAGFTAALTTNVAEVVHGAEIPLELQTIARYKAFSIERIILPYHSEDVTFSAQPLKVDTTFVWNTTYRIPSNHPYTEPYWLAAPVKHSQYQYPDSLFSLPAYNHELFAKLQVNIAGESIMTYVPLSYKYLNPLKGDVIQPLRIVPALFVKPIIQQYFFDDKDTYIPIQILVRNNGTTKQGEFQIQHSGNSIYKKTIPLPSPHKDSMYVMQIPSKVLTMNDQEPLQISIESDGKSYNRFQHKINYDHLPELVYYEHANIQLIRKSWKTPTLAVGYIPGAGDMVMASLKTIGVDIQEIPVSQLNNLEYLKQYDAIVIGVRAYNTVEALGRNKDVMLQYMQHGGNIIVQYNTHQPLVDQDFAPYPFKISRDRVTDENATVKILQTQDPLLLYPNPITAADFEHWVQERGLYFPTNVDPQYRKVFEMSDPGEAPLQHALIYAPYGQGYYIYTGLSFFRQLPAGNVGAIKLFLNMLSLGAK